MVSHKAYYLLRCVPQLLHSGFLTQKTFDAITKKLQAHLEREQITLKVNFEERWKVSVKKEVKTENKQNVKAEPEQQRGVKHLVDPI